MSWLSLILLAGCGGTNTTDGMSPYNRGTGMDQAPTSSMNGAPSANDLVAVDAFLNVEDIKDAKQATLAVDGLKKLSVPPKRIFLIAPTATSAEWFKKPLAEAKITPLPIPGPDVKDWSKVLKTLSSDKVYSNGPSNGGPNADMLAADQSKFTSTAVYDGVRFFFLNTDTPLKTPKAGSIPRLWFMAKQNEMKENSAVVIGYRSIRSLGTEDTTPVISTNDIIAKNSKIKVFVSASSKSPSLSRPDEKSIYHMAVGGAVGDDHLPHIGLIEVRKNGALTSKIVKLDVTKPGTASLTANLFEPMSSLKNDPKISKDAKTTKELSDTSDAGPTKPVTKDAGKDK
jgi:hypothetical protein